MFAAAETWEKMAPLPVPIGGMATGVVDGQIVSAGGTTWHEGRKIWLDTIHVYDAAKNSWRVSGTLSKSCGYAAYGVHGRALVQAGGSDGTSSLELLMKIAPEGPASTQPLGLRAVYAGGSVVGDALYVLAGSADSADLAQMKTDFCKVDVLTGKAAALPPYPGKPVMLPACAVLGDTIYAFSGANPDTSGTVTNTASAHAFSVKEGKWRTIRPLPVAVRGLAACALDNTHILLAGGYTDKFSDQAWIYDAGADTYAETTRLPLAVMPNLVKLGEYVYCIGGEDRMKSRTDAVHRAPWKDLLKAAKEQ